MSLQAWVQAHRVSWETRATMALDHGQLRPVGFEVTLCAAATDLTPACGACAEIFRHLRALASAVLPEQGARPTACRVRPFDGALHVRSGVKRMAPEVELTVQVEHRHEYFAGVDECELRCTREIQDGLKRLGVVPAEDVH